MRDLRPLARLALPVGLAEGLEARRLFRRRGWGPTSLRTYRQAWLSRLHLLPVDLDLTRGVVVDVGANEGNFSAAVLALAPNATVIAVEPSPGPRARLQARLGDKLTIVPSALAGEPGTAVLHVTAHDHNTSLHQPREEMQELYEDPGWKVVDEIEVPTDTLDALVGDREVAALKLDVQGAEMDVLAGGRQALERTRAVLLEVTFVSHYEADATFPRLDAAMRDLGFELTAFSEPGFNDDGIVTWADACYARRNPGYLAR